MIISWITRAARSNKTVEATNLNEAGPVINFSFPLARIATSIFLNYVDFSCGCSVIAAFPARPRYVAIV